MVTPPPESKKTLEPTEGSDSIPADGPVDDPDTDETPGKFRTLAEVGRQVVRHAVLDDPELARRLEKVGALNPAIAHDPEADPVVAQPRRALAKLLSSFAAARQTSLGAAGVGGLEALAAVLDSDDTADGHTVDADVCVCFTDIENFTRFTEARGDDAALALLQTHAKLVEPPVFKRGGKVRKRLGDGLMITFPDPVRAMLALLDMQERVEDYNGSDPESALRVRAGLTVGRPIAVGEDLVGSDVNLAARITDAAKGGEILADLRSVDAAQASSEDLDEIEFSKPKARKLKGFRTKTSLVAVSRRR